MIFVRRIPRFSPTHHWRWVITNVGPMKAAVIYESLTGNTRRAGELIADGFRQKCNRLVLGIGITYYFNRCLVF